MEEISEICMFVDYEVLNIRYVDLWPEVSPLCLLWSVSSRVVAKSVTLQGNTKWKGKQTKFMTIRQLVVAAFGARWISIYQLTLVARVMSIISSLTESGAKRDQS
jgi:hypothetical protein